jgi:hypothetical protein
LKDPISILEHLEGNVDPSKSQMDLQTNVPIGIEEKEVKDGSEEEEELEESKEEVEEEEEAYEEEDEVERKEEEEVEKGQGKGADPLAILMLHTHFSETLESIYFIRVLNKAPHPYPHLIRGRKSSWDQRKKEAK